MSATNSRTLLLYGRDSAQEKNVGSDVLAGKVGRIYMPKQTIDTVALAKPKGLKRERRAAAAEAKAAKRTKQQGGSGGGGDDE
jgi:hypothetical protein